MILKGVRDAVLVGLGIMTILLAAPELFAAEETVRLGGYLESFNQVQARDYVEYLKLENTLRLKLRASRDNFSLISDLDCFYDAAGYIDENGEKTESVNLDLKEAYIALKYDYLEIRVGKHIIRWGTTDEYNPTDLVNPEDYRDFFTEKKIYRKLGSWMTYFHGFWNDVHLETVWLPVFEPGYVPGPDEVWADADVKELKEAMLAGQVIYTPLREPEKKLKNSEVAARLSTFWKGLDLSASYFYGFYDLPYNARSFASDGSQVVILNPEYRLMSAVGADFAWAVSWFTLRGEGAYYFRRYFPIKSTEALYMIDEDGLLKRNEVQVVMGIDCTYSDFYINIQYLHNQVMDFSEKIDGEEITNAVTLQASNKFLNQDLELGVTGVYNFPNDDFMAESYGTYNIWDGLEVTLGGFYFNGPDDSFFGQYRKNDLVYTRLKYSF